MRTEQLLYFIETAKWRSMNLASEKLHITQQTLSVAIRTLEKELDVQLLERRAHLSRHHLNRKRHDFSQND